MRQLKLTKSDANYEKPNIEELIQERKSIPLIPSMARLPLQTVLIPTTHTSLEEVAYEKTKEAVDAIAEASSYILRLLYANGGSVSLKPHITNYQYEVVAKDACIVLKWTGSVSSEEDSIVLADTINYNFNVNGLLWLMECLKNSNHEKTVARHI